MCVYMCVCVCVCVCRWVGSGGEGVGIKLYFRFFKLFQVTKVTFTDRKIAGTILYKKQIILAA